MAEPLPLRNWLQFLMILTLVAGGFSGNRHLLGVAAVLAIAATALEWGRLLKLARVFAILAVLAGGVIAVLLPDRFALLWQALVQGVSFAALMMVLGMLRRPVRRSAFVRSGTQYLLAFEPKRRYAAINIGAHFLSLLFNVGMIAMIGDLARAGGSGDAARRPMVIAAMRGAALVSIWSPIGLGFAIVTAGVPALDGMQLMLTAFAFTAVVLVLTSLLPLLPADARGTDGATAISENATVRPLLITLGVCALLLAVTIGLHRGGGVSFTLASVAVLPVFTAAWLWLEIGKDKRLYLSELKGALAGLGDLRSESAIFLSANVIGAAISIVLVSRPEWREVAASGTPALPVLLAGLFLIPLAAACFIPNSIFVVILAQLLGASPIGTAHPLALGVMLTVAWASAVSVSPISAMCLITAAQSGVSPQRVAWRWNAPFAILVLALAAALISGLVAFGR
ncbi:hypothetical protein NOF55_00225 [Rhizobiaceae bacterium BDR2-2]|uniref:Uncharacterized protein n=1 Tax=Ectorhizobium quercum TaxID=2965071 RepID=A0AAE3SUQ5_9HYPH|nr:hypothetical protein [Ectorhizobium quercum]MCX8995530.1 hypothetical protein [Ectorhizobium quercum]